MKKTLLTIFTAVLSIGFANAQCTPDASLAGESFGLWPDSLATVYTCEGCGDHTRVVDLVTFADTVMEIEVVPGNPITATIFVDAFKITEVRGVPSGMVYGTDIPDTDSSVDSVDSPFGIWFNGGTVPTQTSTQGCVYINGAEAQWNTLANGGTGMVQLEIDVDVRIAGSDNSTVASLIEAGTWMSDVPEGLGGGLTTMDDYWLVATASAVGIKEVDGNKFMLVNNYPNPFTGITNISFNAPDNRSGLEFNVYSILGNRILTQQINANRGMNNITFDGSALASGLYIYTLSDGNTTLTHKMNIE